jgi:hypothetical protein
MITTLWKLSKYILRKPIVGKNIWERTPFGTGCLQRRKKFKLDTCLEGASGKTYPFVFKGMS